MPVDVAISFAMLLSPLFFIVGINVYELNEFEPLGNLPHLKFILVTFPKTATTGIFRMMTNAMAFETTIRVRNLSLQRFKIERRIFTINARRTGFGLHFEHYFAFPL
jgi:hypothetical protein